MNKTKPEEKKPAKEAMPSKAEAKAESKVEAKAESKVESKVEAKVEAKAEQKPAKEAMPSKAEPKAEPKAEQKPAKEATPSKVEAKAEAEKGVQLPGLYAFKLTMSSVYDDKGSVTPVTFLQVKPWVVTQVKQAEKEGYNSVQIACVSEKKACAKALSKHLTKAKVARFSHIREIRCKSPQDVKIGQQVSINSLQKGDQIKLQAISKGHGFAGVVKRWGFKGGPASHGSKVHRVGGSIGNRTEPSRVQPGKKMPGHYGAEKISIKNVKVMNVISDKNLIVVKGSVPGSRNTLVFLSKTR